MQFDPKARLWRTLPATLLPGLLGASPAWAQQGSGYYHGHMWDGGWHGWFFGPLMIILFVALVVIGILLLVRWFSESREDGPTARADSQTPLDILKERFARGEIDKEEYEERRRVLEE